MAKFRPPLGNVRVECSVIPRPSYGADRCSGIQTRDIWNPADYVRLYDAPLSTADVRAQSNRPSLGCDSIRLKRQPIAQKWNLLM